MVVTLNNLTKADMMLNRETKTNKKQQQCINLEIKIDDLRGKKW